MRDPKRIDRFCDELKEYWKRYPDFRFGQLVFNSLGQGPFMFYVEDDDAIKRIDAFTKRMCGQEE